MAIDDVQSAGMLLLNSPLSSSLAVGRHPQNEALSEMVKNEPGK